MSNQVFYAICGKCDSRQLLQDALTVLEGMGLETGDVVIARRPLTVVHGEHTLPFCSWRS